MAEQVEYPLSISYPLSGAVTQAFSILPSLLAGAQFGLINVRLGASADPEFERRVVERVGSYGRQIGRIGEVLAILVERTGLLERDDLSAAERAAVHALMSQVASVAAMKERRALSGTAA